MKFYYDAQGRVAIVDFNGTKYAYVHNLQGDIIAIVDSNGVCVVEYKYDAWGKPIGDVIGTLAELNPFRYRGYVWDQENGLYYLRRRFYSINDGRFLSIDMYVDTSGVYYLMHIHTVPTYQHLTSMKMEMYGFKVRLQNHGITITTKHAML